MSEKSWASLAPLLDNRRYVESIVAGIKIKAHPQFRLVATMNDDASTFELPEYIHSRLQPQILIDFPERDEEYHDPEGEPAVRRRAHPELRHRFPAAGARRRRALHRARRHQHRALRHQAEEPGHRADARNRGAGNGHPAKRWERKRCAMPGEIGLPDLPDAGSLRRGRFTYFPVVPGRLEFAIEVRQAILRERPQVVAVELPVTLQQAYLRAVARLPEMSVIFYPDETRRRGARHLCSGRAGRSVHRSHPHRRTKSARTWSSPIPIRASVRICPTLIPTRTRSATSASRNTSRRTASIRSRAPTRSRATPPASPGSCKAPIRWRSVLVVVSLNLLDPLLDAMEEPQAQPMTRLRREGVRAAQSASRIAWPRSPSNIRICRSATSSSAR